MKRRTSAVVVLLCLEHGLFVLLTLWLSPTKSSFGVLFLAWMILPAFTAAIGAIRKPIIWAAVNGAISAMLVDYLFIVHYYYWHERPENAHALALGYLLLGVGVSSGCGAFVHIIRAPLDKHFGAKLKARLATATKKGLTFSTICVVVTLPVLLLLLPPHAWQYWLHVSLGYSIGGILSGTLVASVVGALYVVPCSPSSSTLQDANQQL